MRGVGVLDVIDGVVVVGLDGLVQIEVDALPASCILKRKRALSMGTSSNRSVRVMALPVRLDIRTGWPFCIRLTICIRTTSRRLPSRPMASIAPFMRATWPWWSAPHTSMALSKPRVASLL